MMAGVTYTGYKPFAHQRAVHNAISRHVDVVPRFTEDFQKVFTVNSCRQVGKSMMALNELLRFGINWLGSVNLYVAPTFALCRKMYGDIVKATVETGVIARKNEQLCDIELVNGSIIHLRSAEQGDALRGMTVTGVMIIDEASFQKDDFYNEVLTPFVDFHKAITIIISTPRFRTGFFYANYIKGLSGLPGYESFSFMDYDLSHIRSALRLEQKRRELPTAVFKTEYLGEFLDAESMVFGCFKDCIIDSSPAYSSLSLGLDFGTGSGQDYTVLTALNEKNEQVFIHAWNDITPTAQVDRLAGILTPLASKIKSVKAEQNSIGAVYLDMLRKACPKVRFRPFLTTNDSKRKLVERLQNAFEQKKITILANEEQARQLEFYELNLNPRTNIVSYNAPAGMHDDMVIALMLAYDNSTASMSNRISII